jgi:hypothetical protein
MPWIDDEKEVAEGLQSPDPEIRLQTQIMQKKLLLRNARGNARQPGGGYYKRKSASTIRLSENELRDLEGKLARLRREGAI